MEMLVPPPRIRRGAWVKFDRRQGAPVLWVDTFGFRLDMDRRGVNPAAGAFLLVLLDLASKCGGTLPREHQLARLLALKSPDVAAMVSELVEARCIGIQGERLSFPVVFATPRRRK